MADNCQCGHPKDRHQTGGATTICLDCYGSSYPHRHLHSFGIFSPGAEERIASLSAELEQTKLERDLAIAHDTQPYPTADAYEKVCAARDKWKALASNHEFCPRSSQLALDLQSLESRFSLLVKAAKAFMAEHECNGSCDAGQALMDALQEKPHGE